MKVYLLFVAAFVITLTTNSGYAATCTWTGGTSNWNNAGNWDCGVVPDANDDVTINSGDVTLDIATSVGAFTMTGGKLLGGNILTIGGTFSWTGGEIELEEGSAAADIIASSTIILSGSTKTLGSNTTMQLDGSVTWSGGSIFGTSGTVVVINSAFVQSTSASFTWSGLIPTPRPKLIVSGDYAYNAASGATFFWAMQIDGTFTFQVGGGGLAVNGVDVSISGTVDLADASMTFQGTPITITSTGIVKGVGTFGFGSVFNNSGTFRPGTSPGIMSITAVNSTFTNGTLDIELDSYLGAGDGHDQLDITGTGDLSGQLNISHTSGFSPISGDVFTIMKCSSGCSTSLTAPTSQPGGFNYGVASMGDSIVVGPDLALPVELVAFDVIIDDGDAVLSWETMSETNNSGFEIQSQAAGNEVWTNLDFVSGQGTTSQGASYTFRTTDLKSGHWRFRLRQVDMDGTYAYSPILAVTIGTIDRYEIAPVYPNPFRDFTTLELVGNESDHVQVKIFDVHGREVAHALDEMVPAGVRRKVTIDASAWASGVYFYRVVTDTFAQTGRMLKVE